MNIHKVIGKLPRPKKGFVLPYHKYTGPYNPLYEQLDESDQPLMLWMLYLCDIISATETMKKEKKCDDIMLQELHMLQPHGFPAKIDRKLVRNVICEKRKLGWGIVEWSNELTNELHKTSLYEWN